MLLGMHAKLHTVVCISAILEGSLGDVATTSKGRGLCQECRNYELAQTHNMSEMPFYGFRHFPVYQTIGRFNSGFCYEKYRIDNVCKNGSQLYSLVKSYGCLVRATCRLEEDVSRSATSFRPDSNIH